MKKIDYPHFQTALLEWFNTYQREMPWRNTGDAYRIWVSEVMLQQTQVKKVMEYYQKFIDRFPTVQHLAEAELQTVLKLWERVGLLYQSPEPPQSGANYREGIGWRNPQRLCRFPEIARCRGL